MIHPTLPFLALFIAACQPIASPGLPGEVSRSDGGGLSSSVTPSPLPPNPETNLLPNHSFESPTPDPWYDFSERSPSWLPYSISDSVAHTGTHAAHLHMDSADQQPTTTAIHGVVQSLSAPNKALPAYISGHYKVTNWNRSTPKQYLQLVFMASRPPNKPAGTNYPTYQLAIPLAGVTEPPIEIANRRFAFDPISLPPQEPIQDQWIFFEYNLPDLYQQHWGFIPENSKDFRVFFEVRYDNRDPDADQPATADVYYDTLYLGPDSRTPTPTPTSP